MTETETTPRHFVTVDGDGRPTAFYRSDWHVDIPSDAVTITAEQHDDLSAQQHTRALIDGAVVEVEQRPVGEAAS